MLFHFYSLASLVVVFLVQFKPDKVSFFFYTSNSGRATAHAIVKHYITWICVCANEILNESDGLLSRVEAAMNIPLKYDNISWIFFVSYNILRLAKVALSLAFLCYDCVHVEDICAFVDDRLAVRCRKRK